MVHYNRSEGSVWREVLVHSPERPQSAHDTSFSGRPLFLLRLLSPRQKSQMGFGLASGFPYRDDRYLTQTHTHTRTLQTQAESDSLSLRHIQTLSYREYIHLTKRGKFTLME